MIRVLVADDHGIVRKGIVHLISQCADMTVAAEAATGEEALALARKERYDVAILDINMPGRGGLDVVKDIRAACPGLRVIILSMYSEEQFAVRCLRDGASAYLTKARADIELIDAIRAVAGGRRYITAEVAERLAYYVEADSELPPHERLTEREYQVLTLIGSGLTVTQVGERLALSPKTVSTYRARILAKMGLSTNAQLIKYAVDHRLSD